MNEKTGATSASGQTSGIKHSSQSEVTANEKGGLADAQSSGPGKIEQTCGKKKFLKKKKSILGLKNI